MYACNTRIINQPIPFNINLYFLSKVFQIKKYQPYPRIQYSITFIPDEIKQENKNVLLSQQNMRVFNNFTR